MKEKRSFFNLNVTLEQAAGKFKALEPEAAAKRAGTDYDRGKNIITMPFIDQRFNVCGETGAVSDQAGNQASSYISILILHYLVTARGTPLAGSWISYRHLPGGDIYMDPFQKRAVLPFLKTFGERPEDFEAAASSLGGLRLDQSGISIAIPVMPRVPLLFVLWPGDDEMAATANILFDQVAADYLPTEDYAHLPAMVTGAMKKKLDI